MPDLILASTSPYRRQLLDRLGLPFAQHAPICDETAVQDTGLAPRALAEELARRKAASIAEAQPQAVVIGSDQLVALDEEVLGKPGTTEGAMDQLLRLSGRAHDLITAVVVQQGDRIRQHTDITRLHMRPLDRATCARYVAEDQPLDCAGAYKLEARGIVLFARIDSADHSAITGLPLIALTTILEEFGLPCLRGD